MRRGTLLPPCIPSLQHAAGPCVRGSWAAQILIESRNRGRLGDERGGRRRRGPSLKGRSPEPRRGGVPSGLDRGGAIT